MTAMIAEMPNEASLPVSERAKGVLSGHSRSYVEDAEVLASSVLALQKQVDELQARMTEMVESSLSRRVRAFHLKFGHPVATTPSVPDESQVRFRLKLIAEEFFELLDSTFDPGAIRFVSEAKERIEYTIAHAPVEVDLPEFVDALADIDYVVEGTRAAFGVLGASIAAEVHRANMAKDPTYVASKDAYHFGRLADGGDVEGLPVASLLPGETLDGGHASPDPSAKPTKPSGWRPPDVEGELVKQGWVKS